MICKKKFPHIKTIRVEITQNITVHGNFAQTLSGNISQDRVIANSNYADMQQLISKLLNSDKFSAEEKVYKSGTCNFSTFKKFIALKIKL